MSSTQEVGDIFGTGKGQAHAMLRSPTVLIVSLGLWGMNVFFFRLFGLDYESILAKDVLELERRDVQERQMNELAEEKKNDGSGGGGGGGGGGAPTQRGEAGGRVPSSRAGTTAARILPVLPPAAAAAAATTRPWRFL